ncbi:MAG: DUF4386 domain-containing protein [Candidatus Methanoperedens sp.]|nr:DUF4386 domain-containing protein [Candidatus Methanoperedens sp.]
MKKTARITGILFILGFAGVVTAALTVPILNAPDYLVKISENEKQVTMGAFFQFIMAAACAGIGISLYPVLKKYNEGLALGAAGFRIIEAVFHIVGVVILLLLVTLSQEFVKAGAPDSSYFQIAGVLLQAGIKWLNDVVVLLAWSTGAMMYYYIFYQTRLIPGWLAGWGIVGITLTIIGSILVLFRFIPTIQIVFVAPIALQEIVLAVWLITKGFNPTAIDADSAGQK